MNRFISRFLCLAVALLATATAFAGSGCDEPVERIENEIRYSVRQGFRPPTYGESFLKYEAAYKATPEWRKFKVMRAVGWSALGVGLGTAAFGGLVAAFSAFEGGDFTGIPLAIVATGGSLAVASVPILIVGYGYKKKAKRKVLNMNVMSMTMPRAVGAPYSAPGLGFSLTF